MESGKAQWERYPVPLERTLDFIEEHLVEIRTVQQLAGKMGYSRSYFSSSVTNLYGRTPAHLIRESRYKRICREILSHPGEKSYSIARRVGLKDENALYKFLKRNRGTNFTLLRDQLLRNRAGPKR